MRNEQAREREREVKRKRRRTERERKRIGNLRNTEKLNYDFLIAIIQYISYIYIMNQHP